MKLLANTFITLTIIFACGIFAAAQNQEKETGKSNSKSASNVNLKYDKSKDLTTARIKPFQITRLIQEKQAADNTPLHQMDLEISAGFPGRTPTKKVEEVIFTFHATASTFIFLRSQQVIAVLDRDIKGQDRAFSLGMTDYKSDSPKFNSVYEEVMVIKIPADALAKMAKAASLEIYLGPVGYKLTSKQQDSIREFANFLSDVPSSNPQK